MITDDEINQLRSGSNKKVKDDNGKPDDDIDYLPPKVGNAVTIGSVVAGIVALIIVAAIVTSFVFSMVNSNKIKLQNTVTGSDVETTIDPKKTEVPNVVGMSEDEAEKTLH